jgi:hypothetical protein
LQQFTDEATTPQVIKPTFLLCQGSNPITALLVVKHIIALQYFHELLPAPGITQGGLFQYRPGREREPFDQLFDRRLVENGHVHTQRAQRLDAYGNGLGHPRREAGICVTRVFQLPEQLIPLVNQATELTRGSPRLDGALPK